MRRIFTALLPLSSLFEIALILPIAYLGYISSGWHQDIEREQLQAIVWAGRIAEEVPEPFLEIMQDYAPINDLGEHILNGFLSKSSYCPCHQLVYTLPYKQDRRAQLELHISLYAKIRRVLKQEECLALLLAKYDFLYGNIGLASALKYYFNKSSSELSERDWKIVYLMFKNPIYYNPKTNLERLDWKLERMEKYHNL